jgi:hypothetical protein
MSIFNTSNLDYPVYAFVYDDASIEDNDAVFLLTVPTAAGEELFSAAPGLTGNTDSESFEAKLIAAIAAFISANSTGGLLRADLITAPEITTNVMPS